MTPKALLSAIRQLQANVDLHAAQLEQQEAEALHDLRIDLRRLRSLIKPVAQKKALQTLDTSGRALAQLTNPARELEVLLADLEGRRSPAAIPRRQRLETAYAQVRQSPEFGEFRVTLFEFLAITRTRDLPDKRTFKRHILSMLSRWQAEILESLPGETETTIPDDRRHALRINIKRLRYTLDTFSEDVPGKLQTALKRAQDALGDWHDRWNWLLAASTETDLQELIPEWQEELAAHAREADAALLVLEAPLRKWDPLTWKA